MINSNNTDSTSALTTIGWLKTKLDAIILIQLSRREREVQTRAVPFERARTHNNYTKWRREKSRGR